MLYLLKAPGERTYQYAYKDVSFAAFRMSECEVCGWEYDEELGYPEGGIAPDTAWEDIPEDFECPLCSVGKDMFSEE